MFDKIRIVLVAPTHPGNIGAVARAMKTMGLSKLYLVNPKIFPHVEVTARAAGADDLLEKTIVTSSLDDALQGCSLVVGTSARIRELPVTILNPREVAEMIVTESQDYEVAVVFGRESSGLNNEELRSCNYHVYIPTNPEFNSLNLAAAVQVIAYEIYMASCNISKKNDDNIEYDIPATFEELELFYKHLEQTLIEIEFLDPQKPRRLMKRLRRLFNRTRLEKMELNILRGILTEIDKLKK